MEVPNNQKQAYPKRKDPTRPSNTLPLRPRKKPKETQKQSKPTKHKTKTRQGCTVPQLVDAALAKTLRGLRGAAEASLTGRAAGRGLPDNASPTPGRLSGTRGGFDCRGLKTCTNTVCSRKLEYGCGMILFLWLGIRGRSYFNFLAAAVLLSCGRMWLFLQIGVLFCGCP